MKESRTANEYGERERESLKEKRNLLVRRERMSERERKRRRRRREREERRERERDVFRGCNAINIRGISEDDGEICRQNWRRRGRRR